MLQQFLRTATDGWDLALASVRDLFAEADLHADEVGGDFAAEAHRLGVATAEVHAALAEHFPTEQRGPAELAALADAMRAGSTRPLAAVPELAAYADGLRAAFDGGRATCPATPSSGCTATSTSARRCAPFEGWKLIDFEGEPAKPLAERLRRTRSWRTSPACCARSTTPPRQSTGR